MSVGEAMTESAPGGTRFRMPPALDMSLLRRTVDFDDPKYSRALQVTDMCRTRHCSGVSGRDDFAFAVVVCQCRVKAILYSRSVLPVLLSALQ